MHRHLEKAANLAGFAAENAEVNSTSVKILTRESIVSDDPNFYMYIDQISNEFLVKTGFNIDKVHQLLVILHADLSADIYVNDISVLVEVMSKRDVKKVELIFENDIADIRCLKFPDVVFKDDDKVIYCFKKGWLFGLFFDLNGPAEKLDLDKMAISIGNIYRYLSFYNIYKVLETEDQFNEMKKDGWFPFTEIIPNPYRDISSAYKNKIDFDNKIKSIIDKFDVARIEKMKNKWWRHKIFADKKTLIEAGLNAYLQNSSEGFINCIKNLVSELEGILRYQYFSDTSKGNHVKCDELIKFVVEKAKNRTGSGYSLLLPIPFLSYLKDVVFSDFDLENSQVDLSRNSSAHGVADQILYTKSRAIQVILCIDQIAYYIS